MMLNAINVPRFRLTHNGYVQGEDVVIAIVVTLFLLTGLVGVITFTVHQIKWDHVPPPKVITKVIKENGLTTAQNTYIKQCETNHIVPDNSSFDSYAVPNVEVTPWTCTFATEGGQG
jgi:hypothetical protein